jgi:outer membrane protein OmpA-like peptidoglycan-associated protein
VPAQAAQRRTVPGNATPGRSAPGQSALGQTAPRQAVPDHTAAVPTAAGPAERVANGQLPRLPTGEPPHPKIAPATPPSVPFTVALPATTGATTGATAAPAGSINIDFARGAASLNDSALAEVKSLATTHGNRGIAVTGYGDATASDALGQSDAVALGLSRARALASALVAQGVPYAMLRLNAESAGRGASLRLLQ